MSVIETLTEGIRARSLANEGEALLEKWEKTGLLEGMDDQKRSTMSRLLENQAAQLLKETSTMQAGDVEGFASVAFPIVRRVFGGLLAQDLVSVQPMSLPSGLIFFLDFVYSDGTTMPRLTEELDKSLYGGGRVARQITGGIDLAGTTGSTGFYDLNNGFSSPTGSCDGAQVGGSGNPLVIQGSGTFLGNQTVGIDLEVLRSDPSLVSGTSTYAILKANIGALSSRGFQHSTGSHAVNFASINISGSDGVGGIRHDFLPGGGGGAFQLKRLTQWSGSSASDFLVVVADPAGTIPAQTLRDSAISSGTIFFPIEDKWVAAGSPFGAIAGSSLEGGWGLENNPDLPEIDIKVNSVAVTANTKKLKAKWTPELAQDLNAYHNLDAEVELTSILSEQIALEIDQEILSDLVNGGTAGTLYWSRRPGNFVNSSDGSQIAVTNGAPDFTGTVSEWYETLLETVNDLSARLHRKTLRGGANFIVTSPEVAALLEFTVGFKADVAGDDDKGSWGAVKVGSLSRKMDIYVDPYFTRNLILVGRRGSSFLESGYVYAPYVPLQVTPTIFGTEDFVPRKGVMTRYAKHMVRPDMYGLVIVLDLLG
jgi:hypothetical protein